MKTANRILLAALFVFLVTGLAFGQTMKLPGAIPKDAQLVEQDGDFTYYRIPEDGEAFNAMWGNGQSARAQGQESSADPVWMFDVMTNDTQGYTNFSFKTGETVIHALEFALSSDATVITKWIVKWGPEAWTFTSKPKSLKKGYYLVTTSVNKSKIYKQPGNYLFKGSALANGLKPNLYNTDTFKFWVTQ